MPDLMISILAGVGWLFLCGVGITSYRLQWRQTVRVALVWLVIFLGLYVLVEWFQIALNTTSALL